MVKRYSYLKLPLPLARLIVILFALALLEAAVRSRVIDPFFVAPPSSVFAYMVRELIDAEFLALIAVTLYETGAAFALASAIGVPLGFLLWHVKRLGEAYDPLLVGLFSSPIVLLYPIFLVIFGRTSMAIISLATLFGVLPIILFTRQALAGVSTTLLRVGTSMNLSAGATFRHILLPAAAPTVFTGLRIGLTYVLIVVVAMQYILQLGGLGGLVAETSLLFRADAVYSGVALVILTSAVFIYLTHRAERMVRR